MKRFIYIVSILLLIGIVSSLYFYFETNKYNVSYKFTVDETAIVIRNQENEIFVPNGVTLTATQPGVIPSGNRVSYETYIDWFYLMKDMGLNTVKVDSLMPGKFYKAFKDFNDQVDIPLYLIQGVYFDEVALKDGYSPLEQKWKKAFIDDIEEAIDAVHGNANIIETIYLFKSKPVDVSEYLLGYTLGVNWGTDDIAFSNGIFDLDPYKGEYFSSSIDANSFEIFLAEMLDYAANYEALGYNSQSLFSIKSHGGRLANAIINKNSVIEDYDTIREFPVVDVEHIISEEDLKAGFYVSYDIEDVDCSIRDYSNPEFENSYNCLETLIDYHHIPIVISEYGVPTGRFVSEYSIGYSEPFIDEVEQAQQTAAQYLKLREVGVAGQILRDWQDAWFKSSWYTYNLKVLDHSVLWRDVQTYGQGYGIVGFEPRGEVVHYEDSSADEWDNIDIIGQTDNTIYKMDNDLAAFHVLMKSSDIISDDVIYFIGFDITPNSGSKYVETFDLTFKNDIDFLLVLDLNGNQEIYVHDYYDVNSFRLKRDRIKRYPDEYNPQKDTPKFNQIFQYSDEEILYHNFKVIDDDDIRLTGKLVKGSNNPKDANFLSIADWYKGINYVEIRIPYGLLNFMSPASKMIIDDFNDHHIMNMLKVDGISVEFAEVSYNDVVYTAPFYYTWENWSAPEFTIRTKKVYDVMKQVIRGE